MNASSLQWWLIFDTRDYLFFGLIFFMVLLFFIDIKWDFGYRFFNLLGIKISRENAVFVLGFVSLPVFLLLEYHYGNFIHFIAIQQYMDVRYELFRVKMVQFVLTIIFAGIPLSVFGCMFLSLKKGRSLLKWSVFAFIFNYLALAKLIFLKRSTTP